MKILLLAKYDFSGASSRYRSLQYLDYLRRNGLDITVSSLLDKYYVTRIHAKKKVSRFYFLKQYFKRAYLLFFKKHQFDLVWIENELFPYLPFFLERFFLPKRYIAEYDDAIFHNYDMHRSPFIRKLLGKKIFNVMRFSNHIIAGNEYLKRYALSTGANNITVIPTVVDQDIYKPKNEAKTNDPIVVGWVGSPATVKYLSIIAPALTALAKKAKFKLFIIGGEYRIEGVDSHCHHWPDKWSESEEIQLLNKIDIGIMPLVDSPWEKGKCGFKLIKYMACAKAVVASSVSINREIVEHGKNGYLASSLEEWEKLLLDLILQPSQCLRFGQEGRKKMVEEYSLQKAAPILCNLLKSEAKQTN